MKEILFFLSISFFLFILDFYAFQALKTVLPSGPVYAKILKILYWSFSIFLLLFILSTLFFGYENIPKFLKKLIGLIFFLGALSKSFAIIWLFGEDIYRLIDVFIQKISGKNGEVSFTSRRKFISQIALFSAFAPLAVLTYGVLRNAYNYQFHKVQVALKNLPSNFKGFKIVQLSDIHSGSFSKTEPIEKAIQKINALNPDLILFTGDLVNDLASEMDDYKAIFSKLRAKHGVFSVLGNHDYGYYAFGREDSPEKRANFESFLNVHQEMNWNLLRNENRKIKIGDQEIALIGVENWSDKKYFPSDGDLNKAYEGAESLPIKILMSHDPSHWDAEINSKFKDIDLTLSGHTHGFQFGIETKWLKWSPSQYAYKQWAGLYQEGEQYLYVNRGFGNLGYPGRIGILPEVTVLELV